MLKGVRPLKKIKNTASWTKRAAVEIKYMKGGFCNEQYKTVPI